MENNNNNNNNRKKILLLHGNRQTGQLLLSRMDKLRKKLLKECNIELVAIDAPFPYNLDDEEHLCTWWNRCDDTYVGLEESIQLVQDTWNNNDNTSYIGLFGFSQGARFVHLLATLHTQQQQQQNNNNNTFLPGLQFVILAAGYDAPIPPNMTKRIGDKINDTSIIKIPNLHIWGEADKIILPEQSIGVTKYYINPDFYVHDGGHHIPMRADSVRTYIAFVQKHMKQVDNNTSIVNATTAITNAKPLTNTTTTSSSTTTTTTVNNNNNNYNKQKPDEESLMQMIDEVEALRTIYPDEVHIISKYKIDNDEYKYEYPIIYDIDIIPTDIDNYKKEYWPPKSIRLRIQYPYNYPIESLPILKLIHDNNGIEFSSTQNDTCLQCMYNAAKEEEGMPCILSCYYAVQNYFESGQMLINKTTTTIPMASEDATLSVESDNDNDNQPITTLKPVSEERIRQCNIQGLELAEQILLSISKNKLSVNDSDNNTIGKKGGSWLYTIGLVGKPSAGKSTLFNTATGFARQRQQQQNNTTTTSSNTNESSKTDNSTDTILLGGACMAPHPFTTIDPNIGYCLVPAPKGSCPEENVNLDVLKNMNIGCTHGRDCNGRRLLPVLLKDVAGLVPGAYQGRGRGNQFLSDLTDADVLIHVLDSSGMADAEGNIVAVSNEDNDDELDNTTDSPSAPYAKTHPIHDMAWIRNELIEWVYTNLLHKWEIIRRKGRTKLEGMFSGYGQPQSMTWLVLNAIEKYLDKVEKRDRALDHLDEWDAGDVHRLVSTFLGVRFPIAMALNKADIPCSKKYINDIINILPIHGTHVAIPISARNEMLFIRRYIEATIRKSDTKPKEETAITTTNNNNNEMTVPRATWQCLQSAISLREPVLVFPVSDHKTYAPLIGMYKNATMDPSLPSPGMIACLEAAGGSAPSEWDRSTNQYYVSDNKTRKKTGAALRDAIMMKPGSTVEDVFFALKRLGALSGDFVRAEASGEIGSPAKPIPKNQRVTCENRIIKIMTNKKSG